MRFIAMLLCMFICLGAFAACASDTDVTDSGDNGGNSGEGSKPVDVIYDVGDMTVAVPEGWEAFNNTDIHADDPSTLSKRSVTICKGGTDIFTKPYIKLDYQDESIYLMAPDKSFYDKVVDIAPFELGGRTWAGFSCESLGAPLIILFIDEGDDQYQAVISCGTGDDAIDLEDEEVKRIIASLTIKEGVGGTASFEDSSASEDGSAE